MADKIRVLHVDDDKDFAEMLSRRLEAAAERISVMTVTETRAGLYRLTDMSIDCVVCDYNMPGMDGAEFHDMVKKDHPDLPFIFFTGSDLEAVAGQVTNDDATTYLQKELDNVNALSERIVSAIEVKESEQARLESEERYRRLLETAPGPIFIYSQEGKLSFVNQAGQEFLGADDEADLIGTDIGTFVHPEDKALVDDRFDQLMEAGEPVDPTEQRVVTLDGEEKHAIMASAPITYDGEPAIQTVGTDITEQKERERELERYRTITETLPDIVYTLDRDGRLTSINAEDPPTGHTREELIGEHVSVVMDDADVETGNREIKQLFDDPDQTKATFELDLITTDGDRLPMENHVALLPPDDSGAVPGSIGVLRDISDRKERERQLERERDRFAALFNNLPNPSVHGVIQDGEPVVRTVNDAFEDVFGYEADSVVGESLDELIVPEDREGEAAELNAAAMDRRSLRREVTRQAADGEREFLLHLTVEEVDDRREGYAIYTDITEQKDREAVLARQNDRLDRFASVLSHDLRTPLTVAMGRMEMLEREVESEHIDEVLRSLDRIEQLIGDVRTMVREGEPVGETRPVTLSEMANSSAPGLELNVRTDGDLEFKADPGRVQQVLENLFRNALDHGGPATTVRVGPLDDGAGFFIEDDGPGIPSEERGEVFQPGYSTTDTGTGLGLSIVREIVEAHNWRITVTDGPTGGARFEISGVELLDDGR